MSKNHLKGYIFLMLLLSAAGTLMACGREQDPESRQPETFAVVAGEDKTVEDAGSTAQAPQPSEDQEASSADAAEIKEQFGENCIAGQTFEVELSEYSGKVWFVPFAPSQDHPDFSMQIIQNGEVLTDIDTYVPDGLAEEKFSSLDAVSFFDVNYDGNTDIVLIETYGNTSFAAIYYGFDADAEEYDRYFIAQELLSENLSGRLEVMSVPEIRNVLADGKKNGGFDGYRQAYQAVSRLCELESGGDIQYNLIYFDDDEIPELAAGVDWYYTSLYTYHDGKVYTLMDQWPYGAMGNAGYEYAPGRNSLRNYNSDYAGAILYTTYMKISAQYSMETVAQIETFLFDDVNGNGMPDENEEGSLGNYGVSYIDGAEASDEECQAYDAGGYELIEPSMSLEELRLKLEER